MLHSRAVLLVSISLLLGIGASSAAAQGSNVPPGRPFQALQSQITANSAAISALQSRVSTLEGQVAAIGTAITQLDARVTANTNDIRNLLNATQTLTTELNDLRARQQAELQEISAAIADLTLRVVQMEANLGAMRADLQAQLTQLQQVQGDVGGLTTQVAALTANVVLLQGTLNSQQAALAQLEAGRLQLVAQVNGLNLRIDALEGRVSTLEALHRPVPNACDVGFDPRTNSPWIVCRADQNEVWVSANTGGTYHAEAICQSLGYPQLVSFGGTCGNVCGYCQGPTSCTSPGNRTMDGAGNAGTDDLGRKLSFTVHWVCGK
jgi:peptidoglycan hydrolase CwlO-like protein